MSRLALLVGFVLVSAASARAAELPVGKWSVAEPAAKGELVIKEVARDGKVTATLSGNAVEGTWDGETLKLKGGDSNLEACLVVEEAAKGETKYTLTGFRWTRHPNFFDVNPGEIVVRRGWYAQKVVKEADRIKVEVKGTLVCKDTTEAYVRVYRDEGFGLEEEIRIHFRLSEGEWKHWKDVLPKLDGQAVTVNGSLGQVPKRVKTSIPEGALYFEHGFVIRTATETFK
jgi:hypothetical protein